MECVTVDCFDFYFAVFEKKLSGKSEFSEVLIHEERMVGNE